MTLSSCAVSTKKEENNEFRKGRRRVNGVSWFFNGPCLRLWKEAGRK